MVDQSKAGESAHRRMSGRLPPPLHRRNPDGGMKESARTRFLPQKHAFISACAAST